MLGDTKMKNDAARFPGSARVSRVGDGVSPSRTFLDVQPAGGAFRTRRRLPHFERPWTIYAATIGTKSRRCLSPTARTIVLDVLRHFPWLWTLKDELRKKNLSRRDRATSTRDACATQSSSGQRAIIR